MVSADRERVAVTAEHEDVQVRARERDATGKWESAAVYVMRSVGLDEIGEPARATDARDGGDFFVPDFAAFDEFEIEREDGEIATARAPGRVVGGHLLFGQRLAVFGRDRAVGSCGRRGGRGSRSVGAVGDFDRGRTHIQIRQICGRGRYIFRKPAATWVLARS